MESLLTPLVSRLLSRFVKTTSAGSTTEGLRARLSTGGLVLHNLDLNLDQLTQILPALRIHRAFATQLRLEIPWNILFKPARVVLSGVEVGQQVIYMYIFCSLSLSVSLKGPSPYRRILPK